MKMSVFECIFDVCLWRVNSIGCTIIYRQCTTLVRLGTTPGGKVSINCLVHLIISNMIKWTKGGEVKDLGADVRDRGCSVLGLWWRYLGVRWGCLWMMLMHQMGWLIETRSLFKAKSYCEIWENTEGVGQHSEVWIWIAIYYRCLVNM